MNVLVVNCGGATLKYKLYEMPAARVLAVGHIDRLGFENSSLKHTAFSESGEAKTTRAETPIRDHRSGIEWMSRQLTSGDTRVLASLDEIDVVGHKIAHDGMKLGVCSLLGDYEIDVIREMVALAPVHNPPSLVGIEIFQELLPEVPQTASYETGFHHSVAPADFTYGLPLEWRDQYGVRRYGFHSCSHRYVSHRVAQLMNKPYDETKTVLCHLGSGTSVAAVKNGESVGIASGLTPQSGAMMSTRPGDYDAGAVNFMIRNLGITPEEYDRIEIKESGLKGISGISTGDMRDVEEAMQSGNERAKLAFDVFCNRVRDYLGLYHLRMNGCDAITFTAGIGENSDLVRAAVCRDLECIGAKLDEAKNASGAAERSIHAADSKVQIWVIPTDEEIIVARDAMTLIKH